MKKGYQKECYEITVVRSQFYH